MPNRASEGTVCGSVACTAPNSTPLINTPVHVERLQRARQFSRMPRKNISSITGATISDVTTVRTTTERDDCGSRSINSDSCSSIEYPGIHTRISDSVTVSTATQTGQNATYAWTATP